MKTCPQCGRTYPAEYAFCLSDGAPLGSPQPIIADETPTVVRPPAGHKRIATSTILLFILAGVLTLALGATVGILYVFWPRQPGVEQAKTNQASPTPSASRTASDLKPTPEASTTPKPTQTPTPRNNSETDAPPEPPVDYAADPGSTRISFKRGRAEETVSGSVTSSRSFVLYAKSGQNLSARVRSADRCVTFDGGETRINYPTEEGDNVIGVANNCDAPAKFSLTVSIR
jgi:hypothetical protein